MRWSCWRSKCDCRSVKALHFFHTFECSFDRAHQSVLHLQKPSHKERFWVATSLRLLECHSNEHLEFLKRLLLLCYSGKDWKNTKSPPRDFRYHANALNKQRVSLYGCLVFLSKVWQFTLCSFGNYSGKTASLQPMGTSLSNEAKIVMFVTL